MVCHRDNIGLVATMKKQEKKKENRKKTDRNDHVIRDKDVNNKVIVVAYENTLALRFLKMHRKTHLRGNQKGKRKKQR